MKYGERFEKESVPEWGLYNLDYNALKHYIKAHTTKDQAKAIAIPGHRDDNLLRVEDELYLELCRQHDRVDLFVASKADELSRRLQHLSNQVHRLLVRSAHDDLPRMSLKRQRRLVKYERDVNRCGGEVQALQRFVNAQVVAFRKIIKKYKKWTGSTTLGARFKENVLNHPKSFTRRDFEPLRQAHDELLDTLRAVTPASSEPVTPAAADGDEVATPPPRSSHPGMSSRQVSFQDGPPETRAFYTEPPIRYWNEYDYGSDAGDYDGGGGYAIYIQPDDDNGLPKLTAVLAMVTTPLEKARAWLASRGGDERRSLLPTTQHDAVTAPGGYGATSDHTKNTLSASQLHGGIGDGGYFSHPPAQHGPSSAAARGPASILDTDADDEDEDGEDSSALGYASSDGFPAGYETHYAALPSINDQRIARYRERVLRVGTAACLAAAVALLGIAAVLIATGRHRLRAEVDAGVTLGVVASLGCACSALGMMMARRGKVGAAGRAAVWLVFVGVCVCNGILLVLVMGNTAL